MAWNPKDENPNELRRDVIESAQEAARRSGMSVGEWLDSLLRETSAGSRTAPPAHSAPQPYPAGVRGPASFDRYAPPARGPERGWPQPAPFTSDVRVGEGIAPLAPSGERPPLPLDRMPSEPRRKDPADPLSQALFEIEARQRALNSAPAAPIAPQAATPASEPAHAPTQSLSDLEQQLRSITARIESLQPCGIDRAVETLRDDLAEIGVMLKEALPRQAIEALESEIRSLIARVDGKQDAAADSAAIAGIQTSLTEVRDALRTLTPAESLVGFHDAVADLGRRIDRMPAAAQDPAAMKQLEGAIIGLRGIVSHVASNDALTQLSDEVRRLAARVEQIATVDIFDTLDKRIAAIADALQERNRSAGDKQSAAASAQLEDVIRGLTDKIEQLSRTRDAQPGSAPFEDRLARLIDKLEGSDARLGHLESLERGIADLLIHFERSRVSGGSDAAALMRDVRRTQDSLDAVQGTVSHVVDRLATLESGIRGGQPRAAASPVESPMPAVQYNPAPAERRPIDPALPPDQPLEPGIARSRANAAAERIAASEAALAGAKPPAAEPGDKPNFIAAARRAAQAAMAEPPRDLRTAAVPATSAAAEDDGQWNSTQKIKAAVAGTTAILLVAGTLQFGLGGLQWNAPRDVASVPISIETIERPTISLASADPAPRPATAETTAEAPAAILPDAIASAMNGLPSGLGVTGGPALVETTGSVRTDQIANASPTSTPVPGAGAEGLPPGIGSANLRAAAAKGNAAAEFEVATRFAEGRGVPQDVAQAVVWFERAAKQGLTPAQFRLGGLYEKGTGVTKNLATARRLYHLAADGGHAKAMHNLAVLYAEGVEGKPNYQTAARWFRRAADYGITDSQYNLGVLYARGIGVETNIAEAYKWFALASRAGDREATRKREEVGGQLDKPTLAAADQTAEAWKPQIQPESAIKVATPAGGWDGAPAPAVAKRKAAPKSKTP